MTRTTAGPTGTRAVAPADVVALGRLLAADVAPLTDRLVAAIVGGEASYAGSTTTPREDLWRSCHDNLVRVLAVLTGDTGAEDPFDAPRATGRRRAEQGMPLESVLHAYRLGHRVIWEGLVALGRTAPGGVEALVDGASAVWEVVDVFSSAVADAYRETEELIARRDGRRREALVDALLDGRGAERAVAAEAAAVLDLPEQGAYAVVVLEGTDGGRAAGDALAVRGLRSAFRARAGREVGIVPLGRRVPADVCAALEVVPGVRAGVSPVVEGLAELAVGHRMAQTALRALPPALPGVAELDQGLPGALLVTAPDLADRLVAHALGPVLQLERDERDVLLATLASWLETGGSAGQTASRLYCHRNTVLNRLRRLEALLGRPVEDVRTVVELSLALLALQLLPPPVGEPLPGVAD